MTPQTGRVNVGESAFWQFSLRFYRRPEVPPICIALQDQHGVDVNFLFFVLFLAKNGRQLTVDDLQGMDARTRNWRLKIVQPLREIRRELKSGMASVDSAAVESLRSAIKRDELQAERLQQETLEHEFPVAATGLPAAARAAAAANIAAYSAMIGTLPEAAVSPLFTALTEEFSI